MAIFRISFLVLFLLSLAPIPAFNAGESGAGWKKALGGRVWSFPSDHGAHPEYLTEWWYFTGNLTDQAGRHYGYQLTFFRHGLRSAPVDPSNPWSIRDIHLAHFALTEARGQTYRYTEQGSRRGPGLADARKGCLDVWNLNWSARMEKGTITLKARERNMALTLTLKPAKAPVLHGNRGLSAKGPNPGQASFYHSYTDLVTTGTITIPSTGEEKAVTGTSWFDHEFGSNQLARDQAGWDWFGIHLSDGRDLMIYFLRRRTGGIEEASSGTLVEKDGRTRHLTVHDIKVSTLATWKSPRSGALYPAKWRIEVPRESIRLTVAPIAADQELSSSLMGITYWEGALEGGGTSGKEPVTVRGYAELTGYAGGLGGLF